MRIVQNLAALALAAVAVTAPIVLTGTAAHAGTTDTAVVLLTAEEGGNWDE